MTHNREAAAMTAASCSFPSLFSPCEAESRRCKSPIFKKHQSPASEDHGRFESTKRKCHRRTKSSVDAVEELPQLPALVGKEGVRNDGHADPASTPGPRMFGRSTSYGEFPDVSRGPALDNLDFILEAVARAVASKIELSPEACKAAEFLEPVQDKYPAGCSVDSVRGFLAHIFRKVKLPEECLVRSVVVLKRLAAKHPEVKLTATTWRPVLLGILLVIGKVADDELPKNCEWTHLFRDFELRRINTLEVVLLKALNFRIGVGCSEYVATYFDLQHQTFRALGGARKAMSQPLGITLAIKVAEERRAARASAKRQRELKNSQRNREDAKGSSCESTAAPPASEKQPTFLLSDRISAADLRAAWARHPLIDMPPTFLNSH